MSLQSITPAECAAQPSGSGLSQKKRRMQMDVQATRRGILKNAAKMMAAVTGGAFLAKSASAQTTGALEKKRYPPVKEGDPRPLYSPAVSYGNLLFLSGVGAHFQGTIQEHTQHVLDEIKKNLEGAGSSMHKVLKVSVFLNDLKDYDAMNKVYSQADWGQIPGVRTTVSPAGGIPGNSLIEIDVIAYI
jgi:2-iminobutanoate/2-iminopropanoate deaminase